MLHVEGRISLLDQYPSFPLMFRTRNISICHCCFGCRLWILAIFLHWGRLRCVEVGLRFRVKVRPVVIPPEIFGIAILDVVNYSSQMITFSVAVGRNGKVVIMAMNIGVAEGVKSKRCSRCGIDNDELKKKCL